MASKLKIAMLVEFIIILLLFGYIFYHNLDEKTKNTGINDNTKLLSPRIYSGILEPKSFLIVNYAPLREKLEDFIVKNNFNISIYVENLRTGAAMGINERKSFAPASLNKVPSAMLIMKRIEDGELSMDSMIEIKESDRTSTSGELYKTKDNRLPIKVLIESMLKESDNTAFHVLQHYIDQNDMNLLLTYLDYYSEESTDFISTNEGLVTPKSIYNLFSSLYLSTVLKPEDSEYILSLLTATSFDIKKVANLPSNVTVAQKFGSKYIGKDKYFHSCGIIYDNKIRLFYCIMTKDMSEDKAIKIVGLFVNSIYNYAHDTREKLDLYRELEENN